MRRDLPDNGLDLLVAPSRAAGHLWLLGLVLLAVLSLLYVGLFTALGGETPGKRLQIGRAHV